MWVLRHVFLLVRKESKVLCSSNVCGATYHVSFKSINIFGNTHGERMRGYGNVRVAHRVRELRDISRHPVTALGSLWLSDI